MLRAVVHPASVQDRDGAARLLDRRTRRRFPFIEVVFADQGYQGPKAASAVALAGSWTLEIVRRAPGGFAVLCRPDLDECWQGDRHSSASLPAC